MNGLLRRAIVSALFGLVAWVGDAARAAEAVVLENSSIALRFDGSTGAWTGLTDKRTGEDLVAGPAASPDVEAVLPPALSGGRTKPRLDFACRDGDWEYRWTYLLQPREAAFSRFLTVCNLSTTQQLFQTATYRSPLLRLGPQGAVAFPGSLPIGDVALASIAEGESLGPRSQEPLAILWNPGNRCGLGAWFYSEEEYAPVSVKRSGSAAQIRHSQQVIVRLQSGQSVTLGRQFFWLSHGARENVLHAVQAVYREIGLAAPPGGLPGLKGMVMYCGHPGGPPELNFLEYGGFNALRAYVPTLRRLQVDLLWLLPTWSMPTVASGISTPLSTISRWTT